MGTTKVLRNGQITVPKEIRDEIGLEEGATVLVRVTGRRQATITVLPSVGVEDVFGSLPPRDAAWSLAAARREYREALAAKHLARSGGDGRGGGSGR